MSIPDVPEDLDLCIWPIDSDDTPCTKPAHAVYTSPDGQFVRPRCRYHDQQNVQDMYAENGWQREPVAA